MWKKKGGGKKGEMDASAEDLGASIQQIKQNNVIIIYSMKITIISQ